MLYNSNYIKFVEWSHSRNRKYNDSCQGLGAGEETREVWFKGYTVSILQDEKSSGNSLSSKVKILNPTCVHLEMGTMVNFMVHVLCHN